jgi:succinate dehydrogenase hydrophobic anchor subunit
MKTLQKMGGIAALIDAVTYLVSLGLYFTLLAPMANTDLDFGQFMAFFIENQTLVFIWHLTMYMVNGVFLVILALALHERLKASSPAMAQVATVFGLMWAVLVFTSGLITNHGLNVVVDLFGKDPARAATVKLLLDTVTLGIDSSDRFLGCLWVLLISWAAIRGDGLPKALNYLGMVLGVAGLISTAAPVFKELGVAFGLGIIVWWIWLGIVMLLRSPVLAVKKNTIEKQFFDYEAQL